MGEDSFNPATSDDARASGTVSDAASAGHPRDAAEVEHVLTELNRLCRPSGNWLRSTGLLIMSIAAFFALGILCWNPVELSLLIAVVLLHEVGHLIAMRLFGYRNLQMLFIPLLGAAVKGTRTGTPGWQRAIVSLAGPVPGIMIGHVVLLASVLTDSGLLCTLATLLIALNAFNLIPFFPADGWHFFNDVLFCRSRFAGSAWLFVMAALMIAAGCLPGAWVLWLFGLLALVGAFATIKTSSVVAELRTQIAVDKTTAPEIPPPGIASLITRVVRQRCAFIQRPKQIATMVGRVWDQLNTTPPGIRATVALVGVYLSSLLSAVVVPLVLTGLIAAEVLPTPSTGWMRQITTTSDSEIDPGMPEDEPGATASERRGEHLVFGGPDFSAPLYATGQGSDQSDCPSANGIIIPEQRRSTETDESASAIANLRSWEVAALR